MFEVTENLIQAEKLEKFKKLRQSQLFVSNLHRNVSKLDLVDLFSAVGRLLEVSLHFDKSGHSLGKDTIFFAFSINTGS